MKYNIFLVLAVLFWSGNFIFARMIHEYVEPMELSFFRWFFVLVLLLPYIIINFKRIYKHTKENFLLLFFLSFLGVTGYNTFIYYALESTKAINALLINSFTPIIIIVLSAIILKAKISSKQFLAIIISTFGVFFLILKGDFSLLQGLEFSKGDLWVLLAGLDWALYSIFLKFKSKDMNAFDFLSITAFLGTALLVIAYFIMGYEFSLAFVKNDEVLYSLMYIVIFPSILSFFFWNEATVKVGANKAGQFTHLMPVFGAILAFVFLGEGLELYHLIGMGLIAFGIFLTLKKPKNAK